MSRIEREVLELESSVKRLSQYADELEYAEREVAMWRDRYLHQQALPIIGQRTTYVWSRFRIMTSKEMTIRNPEVIFESLKNEATENNIKDQEDSSGEIYITGEIARKRKEKTF